MPPPQTGGLSVKNLGNVLGNRTQAWSHHLKKAKSLNLQWLFRDRLKVRMHETVVVWEIAVQMAEWLHAPALLLEVLPQKSTMSPDLSASATFIGFINMIRHRQGRQGRQG